MNEPDAPPPDEPEAHVGHDFDFFDPNSPLARYYFQASHVLATLVIVAIFVFFNFTPLAHSDIWGHLKIGEWIVHNQQLPQHELFSPYSDPTLTASNFQWLTQVIQYGTYRAGAWLVGGSPLQQTAGGVEFLRTLHALCEALKALFLLLAFRRMAGSLPLAIGGVVLVFAFSLAPSSVQRPQVFAEVLFAALLWILARPLNTVSPTDVHLSWRGTLAIAAILILWVNIHGSFLIGIALAGIFWLGSVIESIRDRGFSVTANDTALHRPLLGLVLGVIGLSLLNPHGLRAIPDVLSFAKNPNILTMQEWKPLEFSTGGGGHWGYLALLVIITLTQAVSPNVYGPTQILLMAVFGVGPLLQERLMTWWAMLVPVIVVPAWAEIGTMLGLRDRWTSILSLRKTIIASGIVLVGVVWSDLTQCLLGHPPSPLEISTSPATLWPITVDILAGKSPAADDDAKRLDINPLARGLKKGLQSYPEGRFRGAIFTPEAMGDYLVWSLPEKAPVMVYSHVHAFPPRYWDDYMEVLFAKPGWRRILDRERVNLVVASAEQRRDLFDKLNADPAWLVVLDPDDPANGRANRIFAALRKKPLEAP